MPFNTNEIGAQTGRPVELYEFRRGPDYYRYTSADDNYQLSSNTYEAVTMTRNAIEATAEIARNPLKITCSRSLDLLQLFLYGPPSEIVTLTVYRVHRVDNDPVVIWSGRILNISWSGSQADIHCEPVFSSIKRPGLRRLYQKQCPHVLYSASCGVNSSTARITRTVTAVASTTITIDNLSGFGVNYFAGGFVEWEFSTGKFERRAIQSSTGATVVIASPILSLVSGASVRLYPGCNHTLASCNGKFNNADNYGGFPWIPLKNPFGGIDGPVY